MRSSAMAITSPSNLVAEGHMSRCRALAWAKWLNAWVRKA